MEKQTCCKCNLEKPLKSFARYFNYTENITKRYPTCNACRNRYQYKKEKHVNTLTDEMKQQLNEDLKTMTRKEVSTKYNINWSTLNRWATHGIIDKYEKRGRPFGK